MQAPYVGKAFPAVMAVDVDLRAYSTTTKTFGKTTR